MFRLFGTDNITDYVLNKETGKEDINIKKSSFWKWQTERIIKKRKQKFGTS